jgi:hypothetical protein
MGDPGIHPPKFLVDETVLQEPQPLAAVSFGDKNPDKPKPAGFLPERPWGLLLVIALLSEVRKLLFGKFSGCLDDIFLLVGQIKVHEFSP